MTIPFKSGDTFDYSGKISVKRPDGTLIEDFTGWTGISQVRDLDGGLIETLTFVWVDITTGLMRIHADRTADPWPPGQAKVDIQFTSPAGDHVSTQTEMIQIGEDVSR